MSLYDITTLYGHQYQRDSIVPKALRAWEVIVDALVETFPNADEWVDVGCGGGGLVHELMRRGKNAYGIEGSAAAIGLLPVPIVMWDLSAPLPYLFPRSDVVTCFDVAEHVGNAPVVVKTCTDLSCNWVTFGAAAPGQEGLGHIDLREPSEWMDLFAARRFVFQDELTETLKERIASNEEHNYLWWVCKNALVFRRAAR